MNLQPVPTRRKASPVQTHSHGSDCASNREQRLRPSLPDRRSAAGSTFFRSSPRGVYPETLCVPGGKGRSSGRVVLPDPSRQEKFARLPLQVKRLLRGRFPPPTPGG